MTAGLPAYTAVLLAGGQGQRMGGQDKGLQLLAGQPLARHALQRLQAQGHAPAQVLISANRHLDAYRRLGHPVWPDAGAGFAGPLAGFLTGLQYAAHDWVLAVPCDVPRFPLDLAQRLLAAALDAGADLALAASQQADGKVRAQPVFCLLHRRLRPRLEAALQAGERKIRVWAGQQGALWVPFAGPQAFDNLNTRDELLAFERGLQGSATLQHHSDPPLKEMLMTASELNIRLLTGPDLPAYKALRDIGLVNDPEAFTTDFNAGSALPAATYATAPGATPGDHFIVGAFDADNRLLGAVIGERESNLKRRHEATLAGMIIVPEQRSKGIGKALLKAFDAQVRQLDGVQQVVLSVTASNAHAVGLYERAGFERYGLHPGALRIDGVAHDSALMIKWLNQA